MRVAYLCRYLPSVSETFILDEVNALQGEGAEVELWGLDHDPSSLLHDRHRSLLARAKYVPRSSSWRAAWAGLVAGDNPRFVALRTHWSSHGRTKDLRRIGWLARTWRRNKVDVIRVHHAAETARFAVAAAGLASIPVSVAVHARDLFVPVTDLAWVLHAAAAVSTITPYHRDRLLRLGVPSEAVQVLPCAVSIPAWQAPLPEAGAPLRVLGVGRLIPKKGHDLLIRAAGELAMDGTPVELTLVGDGSERQMLVALSTEFEEASRGALHVNFTGAQTSEQIETLLREGGFHTAALACRIAGDGDRDGIPVALLEAMAAGLPVVTVALPGFETEFSPGRGASVVSLADSQASVRECSVADLSRSLAELYRDSRLQARMAAAARAAAESRITPSQVGEELRRMLASLCSNIPPQRPPMEPQEDAP